MKQTIDQQLQRVKQLTREINEQHREIRKREDAFVAAKGELGRLENARHELVLRLRCQGVY